MRAETFKELLNTTSGMELDQLLARHCPIKPRAMYNRRMESDYDLRSRVLVWLNECDSLLDDQLWKVSSMVTPDQQTKVELSMFKQAFDAVEGMINTRIMHSQSGRDRALAKLATARAEVGDALLEDQEVRLVAAAPNEVPVFEDI